ncbi:hypothetical protein OESDEN_19956, partial [Oesophagostomum dentatum]
WARVEKSKLEILQHQLDPSGNFLSYRATMKAAQWRAESAGSNQTIVIPFFVLLLKDLFLLFHGSVRNLPNGHLNFVKIFLLRLKHLLKKESNSYWCKGCTLEDSIYDEHAFWDFSRFQMVDQ